MAKKNNKKNKKVQKQIITSTSNYKFSLDEIDRVFPKVDENSEQKNNVKYVQKEKDYVVIRQEQGKLNELNRYKLEYDLLIWQKFYAKCHELENSFFIQDDNLEKCVRNKTIPDDITIRDLKWRRQNNTYFDKLVDAYNQKRYSEYAKTTVGSESEVHEIIKKHNYLYLILSVVSLLIGCVLFIFRSEVFNIPFPINFIIPGILAIASIILLVFFFTKKKEYTIKKYQAKIKPSISLDEWKEKNCVSEEYFEKINAIKKAYIDLLKKEEAKIVGKSELLIEIKNRMMNIIPIHKDYYTEEGINALLNIVQSRKCDTVRKALRFAKEKGYQTDYLSSTELLARSMNFIEDNTIYIEEYNNLQLELKQEFDKAVEINNNIYTYLDNIVFDYCEIKNDPFIN